MVIYTGQFEPTESIFAVIPSLQQPYCVPAQPPINGGGVGYEEQFEPTESCFAVIPSTQQPYCVPAHPPIGCGCGTGTGIYIFLYVVTVLILLGFVLFWFGSILLVWIINKCPKKQNNNKIIKIAIIKSDASIYTQPL